MLKNGKNSYIVMPAQERHHMNKPISSLNPIATHVINLKLLYGEIIHRSLNMINCT